MYPPKSPLRIADTYTGYAITIQTLVRNKFASSECCESPLLVTCHCLSNKSLYVKDCFAAFLQPMLIKCCPFHNLQSQRHANRKAASRSGQLTETCVLASNAKCETIHVRSAQQFENECCSSSRLHSHRSRKGCTQHSGVVRAFLHRHTVAHASPMRQLYS